MSEPNKTIKYTELPLISVLKRKSEMQFARELLEKLRDLKQQEVELRALIDDANESLAELQSKSDLPGLRYGDLCFAHKLMPGRRTINRELLIMNGVKAAVIEASMKEGKPFTQNTFKDLSKGKGDGGNGEEC